ncbi:hypothetical protein [Xenorhabdus anantnagensis]|uniref:Uncharacterized protein n=1 Tax=Xenorhabdus anantnagensis TaxID=3025875 RepID=A0ABT5LS98_9GAMM|nr:hypothetical protein [Xenorhabdus anantnagensis]MDC9596643.1 hypothetical protein [Xenorhabdus anantnagensis]
MIGAINFTRPSCTAEFHELAHQTLAQIQQGAITPAKLAKAKNIWSIEHQIQHQSAAYWSEALAQSASDDLQYQWVEAEIALIEAIMLAGIQRLAANILGKMRKCLK